MCLEHRPTWLVVLVALENNSYSGFSLNALVFLSKFFQVGPVHTAVCLFLSLTTCGHLFLKHSIPASLKSWHLLFLVPLILNSRVSLSCSGIVGTESCSPRTQSCHLISFKLDSCFRMQLMAFHHFSHLDLKELMDKLLWSMMRGYGSFNS